MPEKPPDTIVITSQSVLKRIIGGINSAHIAAYSVRVPNRSLVM